MTASNPFHLAIPVSDLDVTLAFYEDYLGCSRRRSRWVDLNFFGHQWCFTELMRERQAPRALTPWMGAIPVLTLAWCSIGRLLGPASAW